MKNIWWKLKWLLFGKYNRDGNLVLIRSNHDRFIGNCKYAVMAIQKKFPEKQIIWLVRNNAQAVELEKIPGIKTIIRETKEYFAIVAKAKYILSDETFIEYYTTNGAIQIDFWHGSGQIKKIKYDNIGGKPKTREQFVRWINRNRWIVSGTSRQDVNILCDSGRINRKMGRVLGTPCTAPLVDKNLLKSEITKNKKLSELQSEIKKYNKVFLYAPTWRHRGVDFLQDLNFDMKKLQNICEQKNILFLIKLHPNRIFEFNKKSKNIFVLNEYYDAILCLAMCDVLISDYSSMIHYAMAAGKELIYMHGDIDKYTNNHGIYDWAINDMQGHIINDFNDLCELIKNDIPIKLVPQEIFNKYFDKEILDNPYKFLEVLK